MPVDHDWLKMADFVRYIPTSTGYLMLLHQGDDVLKHLEGLMRAEGVPSATVVGFGFVSLARFGFFDFERDAYDPREFADLEITGLNGSLAWKQGEPSIHAHACGGDAEFKVVGGHVLDLVVGRGSFELSIIVHATELERARDESIGANVLQLRR
jgi:predicted DNA-binding protein with PD1-like motif